MGYIILLLDSTILEGRDFRGITNPLFTGMFSSPSSSKPSDPIKIWNSYFYKTFTYVYGWILQILSLEETTLNLKLFYLESISLYNLSKLHFQFFCFCFRYFLLSLLWKMMLLLSSQILRIELYNNFWLNQ